jgi:molecular chaperone GrpE
LNQDKESQEAQALTEEETPAQETASTKGEPAESTKKSKRKAAKEAKDTAAAEADALREDLQKLQEELGQQKDLLLRTAAEYENYRKRTDREKRMIYTDATADAVKAIIPIADSLEYAVKAQDGATAEYQKGLEMVNQQFQEALKNLGVEAFGSAGEEFDPALHNAVSHIEEETVAENTIVEVFQKGYRLGDKIIRHAMVKVAN